MPSQHRISISLGPTEEEIAELEAKTEKMLAAIDAEQSGERKRRATLKELSNKALKEKHSALIEQISEYSNGDSFEVNMAHQAIYTFTLKPEFAFLESALSERLEDVSVTFDYKKETFSVTCRVDVV